MDLVEPKLGAADIARCLKPPPCNVSIRNIYDALKQVCEGKQPDKSLEKLIETFPEPTPVQNEILCTLLGTLERARTSERPSVVRDEVLGVIGSWGDTISEAEVRNYLSGITAFGSSWAEVFDTNRPQAKAFD